MSTVVAAGSTPESTEYPSQASYTNGTLMCTTAAVYWALSCVCQIVQPMCSHAQMQLLMKTAAATHSGILQRRRCSAEEALQQHEVLDSIDNPCSVQTKELYGYCTEKMPEMEAFVHSSDIYALLQPGESLLLTGAGHTTALFRDAHQHLYTYDSMPARVSRVRSGADLAAALLASHKGMEQFTATILQRADAA